MLADFEIGDLVADERELESAELIAAWQRLEERRLAAEGTAKPAGEHRALAEADECLQWLQTASEADVKVGLLVDCVSVSTFLAAVEECAFRLAGVLPCLPTRSSAGGRSICFHLIQPCSDCSPSL